MTSGRALVEFAEGNPAIKVETGERFFSGPVWVLQFTSQSGADLLHGPSFNSLFMNQRDIYVTACSFVQHIERHPC